MSNQRQRASGSEPEMKYNLSRPVPATNVVAAILS